MRTVALWLAAVLLAAAGAAGQAASPEPGMALPVTPQVKARVAVTRALEYLRAQQRDDGGWHDEQQPPAITALVLRGFVAEPAYGARADFVRRGFARLLSFQSEDGGIYRDILANYNTAIAISALVASGDPAYRPRIERATAYLRSLQWTDLTVSAEGTTIEGRDDPFFGGWGYGGRSRGAGRPDLSNVHIALEALRDAGVGPDDPAFQNALLFVSRLQNFSETNDRAWAGDDGGFIYGPSDDRQGESFAGAYADGRGERRLRSYGSMTYAGLKSFIYAGLTRDDPRVRAAWDWINEHWTLNENPGMALADPGHARNGLFYYYHTLARTLHVYGEAVLRRPDGTSHDWRVELIDHLLSIQRPDGSFVGEPRWMEDNPILTTSYVVLALQQAMADLEARPPR